jgi:pyruvate decarboxylase
LTQLVLAKLLVALSDVQLQKRPNPTLPPPPPSPEEGPDATTAAALQIRQDYIWKRIGTFSRPGDIVIGECGTAQFGLSEATFAANATYVTQLYYGSIGYSVPCCLGAGLAQRELLQLQSESEGKDKVPVRVTSGGRGRLILVVGDGSLQLTVQEIGTIIKQGLKPIMYVLSGASKHRNVETCDVMHITSQRCCRFLPSHKYCCTYTVHSADMACVTVAVS